MVHVTVRVCMYSRARPYMYWVATIIQCKYLHIVSITNLYMLTRVHREDTTLISMCNHLRCLGSHLCSLRKLALAKQKVEFAHKELLSSSEVVAGGNT